MPTPREVKRLRSDVARKPPTINYQDYSKAIERVTNEAIRRLANRAGAKTISTLVFSEIKGYLISFLHNVMKEAVIITRHADRATIHASDVLYVLEKKQMPMYSTNEDGRLKKCEAFEPSARQTKRSQGELAIKRIRHYQKQSGCVMIEPTVFEDLVKSVTQHYDTLKWSKKALNIIQVATEEYIHKVFEDAVLCMVHAKRTTMYPKDLQLAMKLSQREMYYAYVHL